MRRTICALAVAACLTLSLPAQDFTRTELGVESSTLFNNRFLRKLDSGVGGRFTYNFTPSLALETAASYYPTNSELSGVTFVDGGRAISAFAGLKAGIRRRRIGIFFKARPGVISFSDAATSSAAISPILATARKTHAALDVGGVLEFYPSARTILRVDAGGTLVRNGDSILSSNSFGVTDQAIGSINNPFHLAFGVGYRIGELKQRYEDVPATATYQVGIQYSLQSLERSFDIVRDESGVGGWFTYDLRKGFALDASANYFPRKLHAAGFQEGGQMIQAVAGLRWGIRRDRWGVFAKFRPGVQVYTLASGFDFRQLFDPHQPLPTLTNLAFDEGGIFEVYTSKHTMLRFDAGNTVIHFRQRNFLDDNGNPFKVPGFSEPSIQLTAGFGFRF
jgi:hypothetical protein